MTFTTDNEIIISQLRDYSEQEAMVDRRMALHDARFQLLEPVTLLHCLEKKSELKLLPHCGSSSLGFMRGRFNDL